MMIGFLVKSKAGHDKNDIYMVVASDETYVYLADGKHRLIDAPKKKRYKHIQIIKKDFLKDCSLSDELVKKIIKEYKKSII